MMMPMPQLPSLKTNSATPTKSKTKKATEARRKEWPHLFSRSNWGQWILWTSPDWISNKKNFSQTSIPPPSFHWSRNTRMPISFYLKIRQSTSWNHYSSLQSKWSSVLLSSLLWIGTWLLRMRVHMYLICASSSQLWFCISVQFKTLEMVFRCASSLFIIHTKWQIQLLDIS